MLAIIQARSDSRRFPKKVLYKINSKPLILHVIDSIKKSGKVKKILIATSNKKTDDNLIKLLKRNNIFYYRGSLNNVVLRIINASKKFKYSHIIRISGDSPLINSKVIDRAIKIFNNNKSADLITNVFPRTFESGNSVEIIKRNLLKTNLSKMSKYDKEHVTTFFYKNYKKFKIVNFKNKKNLSKVKISVDFKKDLKEIRKKLKLI